MKSIAALLAICATAFAAPAEPKLSADEKIVGDLASGQVAAFNSENAPGFAVFFTEDAEWRDSAGGTIFGRAAIEKALVESFAAEKGRKLEVEIESVRRIGGDVLSAKGTSVLTFPGGGSTAKSFTALHVKKDGRWLISELTESELVQNISPAEAMKSLEGLAGTWEHKGEGITLHTVAAWSPGLRFLTRTTKIQIPGAAEEQTTEIIGWDASVGALRSWTFSSNGCVSEGVWAPSKTGWSIATVTTLPDGSAATDDSTIERVDERTLTLSTMNRVIAGEAQPGIAPITFQGSAP